MVGGSCWVSESEATRSVTGSSRGGKVTELRLPQDRREWEEVDAWHWSLCLRLGIWRPRQAGRPWGCSPFSSWQGQRGCESAPAQPSVEGQTRNSLVHQGASEWHCETLASLRIRPQIQTEMFVKMVSSTSSPGLNWKSSSLLQVTTLEERYPLVTVVRVSCSTGWKDGRRWHFLKLSSAVCSWVFTFFFFLQLPNPVPLGCISVLVTLTLLSSLSRYHLFIYLRVGGEWKEDGVFLKALCNLSVSENPHCCGEKLWMHWREFLLREIGGEMCSFL